MFKYTEEQIEKVVNFWAEQIAAPEFDNGGGDLASFFASGVASLRADNSQPSEDAIAKFKAELAERLQAHDHYATGVDYNPDPILADAAEAAGVSERRFPWKTNVLVDLNTGKVLAKCGYGAPWKEL